MANSLTVEAKVFSNTLFCFIAAKCTFAMQKLLKIEMSMSR